MTILIVDDEANIRNVITKYAKHEGFDTVEASSGLKAIELMKKQKVELIIMDIMMDEMDGFTAIRKIREFSNVPCILLSAKSEEYDKVRGFELGIDDYVTKPFSPKELMLRVSAILKRSSKSKNDDVNPHKTFESGNLVVDFDARLVYVNKKEIELTPREYNLLFYLIDNKGRALSREQILDTVWGYSFYGIDRTIDTHIKSIRKALKDEAYRITTVRGIGYRFDEEL